MFSSAPPEDEEFGVSRLGGVKFFRMLKISASVGNNTDRIISFRVGGKRWCSDSSSEIPLELKLELDWFDSILFSDESEIGKVELGIELFVDSAGVIRPL